MDSISIVISDDINGLNDMVSVIGYIHVSRINYMSFV